VYSVPGPVYGVIAQQSVEIMKESEVVAINASSTGKFKKILVDTCVIFIMFSCIINQEQYCMRTSICY